MKISSKCFLVLIISCAFLLSQLTAQQTSTADYAHYLDQFVDTSANPGDDFFHYAVGKWIQNNPIPTNENSWGISSVVQEETYQRLIKVSEAAAANTNAQKGSNEQKIGDFWYAGMDADTIEKRGVTPLKEEFDQIEAIQDKESLLAVVAHLQYIGVGALYAQGIFQDEKNSSRVALHLYQGGLGLPSRDYYFDKDERTTKIRAEYVSHVAKMFQLLGDPEPTAAASSKIVMKMETDLAGASRKLEDLRDPYKNYNAVATKDMAKFTPSIDWIDFLSQQGIQDLDSVIVGQPEFFTQVELSLKTESIDHWKTYLRWQLINTFANRLSSNFDNQNFYFYGTILQGTPEQRPRWKRILDAEENYLGDALGQLYVQKYFSPQAKQRYEKLTDNIFAAFRDRIQKLDWMSAETKQKAFKKLSTVVKKVGYPEKWRDYSSLDIDRNSYVQNCIKGNMWLSEYFIQKLHKPVDHTEWNMTPQTYNAYYNPSNNEIVLPAAIFILPGIPDEYIDDALVYSYAGGTTIGHEITHGFDDQGRQFDDQGNLKDWWTQKDQDEFGRRAKMIIQQFNEYVAVDDLHVNGEATQGENIADLGGIVLGWDAFTKTEEFKSGKQIGGFTPAQRYFIGWALGWMNNLRPQTRAVRVKTDVHAPSFLRANGPVSNLPEFYKAFDVKPGQKMYRPENTRVRIW